MKLHQLSRLVTRKKKRLGRGYGSGKAKTSGRGTKGQKARGNIPMGFEGGQLPMIKRLPLLRGKGKNRSQKERAMPVHLSQLRKFPSGTNVTLEILRKHNIIGEDIRKVKIVGKSTVLVALTVAVPCSKSARTSIAQAGGSSVV